MIIDRLMKENGYATQAVLLVAHAGDESLWFGGILTQVPFEWTIVCCGIDQGEPVGAWKFQDVCDKVAATGRLVPLSSTYISMPMRPSVFPLITPLLKNADVIVTHGFAGEIGNRHHMELARHVSSNYANKAVHGCYGAKEEGPFRVELYESGWERKKQLIECYDHYPHDGAAHMRSEKMLQYDGEFDLKVETYICPE